MRGEDFPASGWDPSAAPPCAHAARPPGVGADETAAGALLVFYSRPYDIGDRVVIAQPGGLKSGTSLVVSEIHLLSTRFVSWDGEQMTMSNYILRRLNIVNYTRSAPFYVSMELQLPTTTTHDKVTELIDCIRAYCSETPQDWASGYGTITNVDYERGILRMMVFCLSAHSRADEASIEVRPRRLGGARGVGHTAGSPSNPRGSRRPCHGCTSF